MRSRSTRRGKLAGLVVAAALASALAACGEDSPTTAATTTTVTPVASAAAAPAATFPVTVKGANGEVTIKTAPKAIVSLSATATEMLFAIGAGTQVKAVDDQSNFPAEAPHSSLSGFNPNLEAIVGIGPDLVVSTEVPPDIVDGLKRAGIPLVVLAAATQLEDSYSQIETLGKATGQTEAAQKVVSDLRARITATLAKVPKRPKPLTYYHELDNTLYSVTSKTFVGNVYALAGLTNIADGADPKGTGYPQLSAEYLLQADPDLIFLADTKCCAQNAQTVGARPGWSGLRAVKNGSVIGLDDDIASRWGPRIADFLDTVVAAVEKVPATTR